MPVEPAIDDLKALNTVTVGNALGVAQDWTKKELPLTWPDLGGASIRLWLSLLCAPFECGAKQAEVPDDLPGPTIPSYAREQFHGLPNGYYSHNIASGYDKGFEASMLFRVQGARRRMARLMARGRVLDVGCGSGRLIAELRAEGADEVWGLDPSPYMLKIAQRRSPQAKLRQGLIEANDFPDDYFDSVGVCFVFHELPGNVTERAILELYRILRPGAVLCVTEPCREHIYERNVFRLVKRYGFRGLYFHFLAKGVYEPFLKDWQALGDHGDWLRKAGFEVIEQAVDVPFQFLVARKPQALLRS
jgi:ubiquinone/menaquinone biosynthesis C-methylase UbiE